MTLTEHALRGAVLERGVPNRLSVGLPWYRSVPLSAVVDVELHLGGRPVPGLRLDLDDRSLAVDELAAVVDRSWFLQDRQALTWCGDVAPAERVDVVLRVRLCLPNLPGHDGRGLQVLQEARAAVQMRGAT